MDNVVRIEFVEDDRQWLVTLTNEDGDSQPGEPFPASGHENFSKLDQVIRRLAELGYRPARIPYDRVQERRYVFDVTPLDR